MTSEDYDAVRETTNFTNETDMFMGNLLQLPMWGLWTRQVMTPMIVLAGIIGNSMSMIVMKSKAMRNKSYSHYLCALSIFDSLTLIGKQVSLIDEVRRSKQQNGLFHDFSDAGCKIYGYFENISYLMSSWLIVLMSLERVVAVYVPLKRASWCTAKGAIISTTCLFVMMSYTQTYRFIMVGNVDGQCNAKEDYLEIYVKLRVYFYSFVLLFMLPVILVSVFNTLVLCKVCKFPKVAESEYLSSTSRISRIRRRRNKTTFMLLTVSFTYIITLLPLIIVSFIIELSLKSYVYTKIAKIVLFYQAKPFADVFQVLSEMNYAVNFYIYILSGKSFRHELKRILGREQNVSTGGSRTREEQIML